uniref:ADP-ribosylglycohydrolase n=1 Tax=Panagrolaimus davidi TaxID=227884 RepID=A0A914QKY7_9BILA
MRGGDTDTNACIAGALLGARFGVDEIPYEWIKTVKSAPICLLSYGNVRVNLDLSFLSLKDFDTLVYQLSNVSCL